MRIPRRGAARDALIFGSGRPLPGEPGQPSDRTQLTQLPCFLSSGSLGKSGDQRRWGHVPPAVSAVGRWQVGRGICSSLQLSGWRPGLPQAVFAEEGVEQADEPAHDGDDGDLVGLAVGGEALVAGLGGRLATDRRQGRHAEQLTGLGPAATDGAGAAVLAGVAVEGGEAN